MSETKHKHVPGVAYDIENPAEKMIHMVGGGFFNEPRYYDNNRVPGDFRRELEETGKISNATTDASGMTEQAKEVIETAVAVARGEYEGAQPDDLCVIASWARDTEDGLKLRTTPQILLAVAANEPYTRQTTKKYAPKICRRPDDVVQAFGAFRELFNPCQEGAHRGMLPHALRKGLEIALAGFNDYQILKYHNDNRPNLADVAIMSQRKSKGTKAGSKGYPLSRPMFEYIVNGKIVDGCPEVLRARERFFHLTYNDFCRMNPRERAEIVEQAQLTWENVNSHLGSKEEPRPEVWEAVIPFMGEDAITRNLRNFEQAGISDEAWRIVNNRLLGVENSKQLPFRFAIASKYVKHPEGKQVCELMLDRTVENVPDLDGRTAIFSDNSGSATGSTVSKNSELRVSDAGNMLAAIAAKKFADGAYVGVFGDSFIGINFDPKDSAIKLKEKIDRIAQEDHREDHNALCIDNPYFKTGRGVGGMTETGLWFGLDYLTREKIHVDRIIICSDMCCYTQGDINNDVDMSNYFGEGATIQKMVDNYRQYVNPDVKVYSVNLAGFGQAQVERGVGDRNHVLLSGWSENIFKTIKDLESPVQRDEREAVDVPVLEALRERYKVN